jgi:hypothetical protein
VLIRLCGEFGLVVSEVGLDFPGDTGTVAGRADIKNVGLAAVARLELAILSLATAPPTVLKDERVVTVFVGEACR